MSARGFRHAGHTPSLAAALAHFDISFMVWVLLGALGAYVASDLQLTPAQKGLMVALPPLGGAAFRILLGSIADRVGLKRTGLITLALTAIPLLWGALAATTYAQILAIGVLLGIAGASFVVALPLASRWYPPEHQGLAMGIAGAGNSGTIIAALAAPRLAEHVGWHGVFGLALIPVAVTWIAFALLAQEPPRAVAAPTGVGVLVRLGREADARWFCLLYLVTFGGFVGLANYLPIFFVDRFDLSKVTAASYAALCAAAGSLLRPLGGKLADVFDGTRVLRLVLITVAVISGLLATLPGLALTVALLFIALGTFGVGNGAVFQVIPKRYGGGRMAAITGLVGAAGGLGGFLLPFGLGRIAGATGSFAGGFLVIAAVAGVASVAIGPRLAQWRHAEPALGAAA